jgi:hypothetical protein
MKGNKNAYPNNNLTYKFIKNDLQPILKKKENAEKLPLEYSYYLSFSLIYCPIYFRKIP